jgi:NADH:ubiquinone oxidoreductase subunit 4 (subunit M)
VQIVPLMVFCFFVFSLANLGVPMTGNFIGELLVLIGVSKYNVLLGGFATLTVIFSAVYSLYLFVRIGYGPLSGHLSTTVDLTRLEFAMLFPLVVIVIVMGVYPEVILSFIRTNLEYLV